MKSIENESANSRCWRDALAKEGEKPLPKRLYTTAEIAQYVGRTPQAVRMMIMRSQIPYLRMAGRIMFDRLTIDNWIEDSRVDVGEDG